MNSIAKRRLLLETIRSLIFHLNEKEISDIGNVLLMAIKRLEKEQEGNNGQANKE